MSLTIALVPHLDAGDRSRWAGDQDQRPLSDLGQRQADALAPVLLTSGVDALYSSPALRCRQTLEPLSRALGLPIEVLPQLRETHGFVQPESWVRGVFAPVGASLGGAFAAGRAWAALLHIRGQDPDSRVIVCSHGDLIPAVAAFLLGHHDLAPPPPLRSRGWWHEVVLDDVRVAITTHEPAADFPL